MKRRQVPPFIGLIQGVAVIRLVRGVDLTLSIPTHEGVKRC